MTKHSDQMVDTGTACVNESAVVKPWYSNLKYLVVGAIFGIVFVKAEIISWFRIQEMFRFESFHMYGVIGTAVGLLLGLGIAFNIDVIVPAIEKALNASFLPKDIYLISKMPSEPQSSDIVPIGLISLVLAFVATLYPSWRASRVNPAEALRYE